MKIDLVTLFPGVVFETEKTDSREKTGDWGALDDLSFLSSLIVSYKRFVSTRGAFKDRVARCIDEAHSEILDQIGQQLDDSILVVDSDVDWKGVNVPSSESLDLLTYFFNLNDIHRRVGLDFMKVILLPDGPTSRYVNDRSVPWMPGTPWRLPIRQDNQIRIKLRPEREQALAHTLERLHRMRPETYRKMMTALGLFNESCRLNVSHPNSSVVLIVSALEALFGMPRREKKEIFAYIIQLFWGFEENIRKWAEKLYELRSKIVHGSVVGEEELKPPAGRYYSHYEIARKIFDDCLRFALETHAAISIDFKNKSEVKKRLLSLLTSNEKKIKGMLGRRPTYHSFEANEYLYAEFLDTIDTLDSDDDSARNLLIPFLQLVFSVTQDWIKSDKQRTRQWMESLPPSNTKMLAGRRLQRYDEIMHIISEIRKIPSWPTGKFRRRDEPSLRRHISRLRHEIGNLRSFHGAPAKRGGFTVEDFLAKCLGATENVYTFAE